ncbi:hypothetical protein BB561_001234 [Smittium simulii]|uniref:CCHC-type domain-containing protein n=1 Tax=Smittium simulii TaxID=133385 RepID=A0A2T9YVH2_9FUNG|nr:hypothetical protein BB561_001234 [Smittium simulii]
MNYNRIPEPDIFESKDNSDPEEWLEKYQLIAKLNRWEEAIQIDLVQLYLGKKEVLWFKKYKDSFKSWDILKKAFIKKFENKELELISWTKVNSLKQKDYSDISELEIDMEILFTKAKIDDERVKFNCLLTALETRYQRKILERDIKDWKKAINLINESERIDKMVSSDPDKLNNSLEHKKTEKAVVVTKVHENSRSDEPMFEALAKKFEKLSLNLISKIDSAINQTGQSKFQNSEQEELYKQGVCYSCKKPGHRKFECPDYRKYNQQYVQRGDRGNGNNNMNTKSGTYNKVNAIETLYSNESNSSFEEEGLDIFYAEKRAREEREERGGMVNSEHTPKRLDKKFKSVEEKNENENLEKIAHTRNKVRRKKDVKMAEDVEAFSLKNELVNVYPKINLAQLIQKSPELRSELVNLCRKVESKEVNQLEYKENRVTNCKALVSVFGAYFWAIVDTGAACSVVNPSLLSKWGLEPDIFSNQIIVTADGKRHETGGKVSAVPILIAGYTFPVDLVVMNREEETLILGTDWFLKYEATINLKSQQLILPVSGAEVILSLSTKTRNSKKEQEETELYAN